MRRILGTLVLMTACIAAVGFYRGWFQVRSDVTDGTRNVTVTVDKVKIHNDKKAADDKAHDLVQK